MKYLLSTLLFVSLSLGSFAQQQTEDPLRSIEGIVNELLEQVTIEKGEKMDTTAIRNLFHPNAILTVVDANEAEMVTIDDFLTLLTDPYYEAGYEEKEIHKVVDQYKGIAQVFQTFYGKDSEGVQGKGINSYQLAYFNDRWWIMSLLWTSESEEEPIPVKYGGD